MTLEDEQERRLTRPYKVYALGLMTAVYTLNLFDRGLMGLLLQPIKEDLGLTDTQLGFVTGIAFAIFYGAAGVPIARWADAGNRQKIAAMSIGLWGITVMGSVLVGNFVQLIVARTLAAVGEAGCKPPTYSLIGDYFPKPAERARAMTAFWLGSPLAAFGSFVLGGMLAAHFGWRMTFFIMGVPGLILALIVKFTLVEPRLFYPAEATAKRELPPISSILVQLWRRKSLRHLISATVLYFFLGYGMQPWWAAFLMRSHGMTTTEVGGWLGLMYAVGGIGGVLLGGVMAGGFFVGKERGLMRLTAVLVALLLPLAAAFLLAANKSWALAAAVAFTTASNFIYAPSFTLLQRLVGDNMRSTTLSLLMLIANLVGMGLGPQLVGVLSDLAMPSMGTDSLRFALLGMSITALWAAFHFWRVGNTVTADLAEDDLVRASAV